MTNTSLDFAFAYGKPSARADFRHQLTDFVVDETLGFEPSGEGEHLYVQIKKRGENTHWVAEKLASFFKVKPLDIGVSGKKDRHAETSQWFSVYLPGRVVDPDWQRLVEQYELNIEILRVTRHQQKLRLGAHQSNAFCILLRNITETDALHERCEKITNIGVPNYFGEQRFGRQGSNLSLARSWFEAGEKIKNRGKRGMAMSAARSYLFNRVLSERVKANTWHSLIEGDVLAEPLLPSGPLWGRGRLMSTGQAQDIERRALADLGPWCEGLEHVGLNQERRPLALKPESFSWLIERDSMRLRFALSAGQFATSVLREICQLNNCAA